MYSNLVEINNTNELSHAVDKIYKWYRSECTSLNIVTVPYNSTLIFKDIIINLIREGKRILYIWNGKGEKKKLVKSIKTSYKDVTCEYIDSGFSNTNITFANYKYVDYIDGKYDLIVYDDISFYSSLNTEEIKTIHKKLLRRSKKVILYSIEAIEVDDEFYLTPLSTEKPFVEPRIINTRIDLNNDIPYILYDYLNWFKERKKRVLLLVPKEENIEYVYDYYVNKLKMKDAYIIKAAKNNADDINEEVSNINNKSIFIITNSMEVILKKFAVDEAVILFSNDTFFSYKRFLYICAYIGKENKEMPEVLLVSKDTSLDMDTAKDISRNFNKLIWEKKLRR